MATQDAAFAIARDAWARRELMPVTDESVWIGGVLVRVTRWKHWALWQVTGDVWAVAPPNREHVAEFIRSRVGLAKTIGGHEFVWIQVWYARRPGLRGGLSSRRTGTAWRGVIHVAGH